MTNELFAHDYIIALIEAAKKATKKLKRRKVRRIFEEEAPSGTARIVYALYKYLGDTGVVKALVQRIKEITGTSNTEELYTLLKELAYESDKFVKPQTLYLLKPALDVMRSFIQKCEKLEQGETENQTPSLSLKRQSLQGRYQLVPSGSWKPQKIDIKKTVKQQLPQRRKKLQTLLENLDPTEEQCKGYKDLFKQFIEKHELTKKDTPFYKRWYYWFMSLPTWKKILIGFLFVVVLFIILLVVFKVGRKVVAALKRAANGDKAVGRRLVDVASSVNQGVKNAAFGAAVGAVSRKAALYF